MVPIEPEGHGVQAISADAAPEIAKYPLSWQAVQLERTLRGSGGALCPLVPCWIEVVR